MDKAQKRFVAVGMLISALLIVGIYWQIKSADKVSASPSNEIAESMDIENNQEDIEVARAEEGSQEVDKTTSKENDKDKDVAKIEEKKTVKIDESIVVQSADNARTGAGAAIDKATGLPQGMKGKEAPKPKPTEPPKEVQKPKEPVEPTQPAETTQPKESVPKTEAPKTEAKPSTPKKEETIVKGGTGSDGVLRDLNGNPIFVEGDPNAKAIEIDSRTLGTPGKGFGEGDKF